MNFASLYGMQAKMSGYLPPGCTQAECDQAQPGYWDEDQRDDDYCEHPYWRMHWSLLTGAATCRGCGENIPNYDPPSFLQRLRFAWGDLWFWLRFDGWWAIKRPFRAVRSWWRGYRRAPWKLDDEIPF